MATIFEKLPASGDKCLVLEPKESYFCPFNLGDWNEIRLTAALSYTNVASNNTSWTDEGFTYSSGSAWPNGFFMGVATSNFVPERTGNFIGIMPDGVTRSTLLFSSLGGIFFGGVNTYYAGMRSNRDIVAPLAGGVILMSSPLSATGSGAYAGATTIGIKIENRNLPNQSFAVARKNNYEISDVSIEKLKTYSTAIVNGDYSTGIFSKNSTPFEIPSGVYIYSPFVDNKIRIHSLVIEKYA